MVSDAGYLGKDVHVGAEEIVNGQFLWNDGTPLIPGTSIWRQKLEGFDRDLRCVAPTGSSTTHEPGMLSFASTTSSGLALLTHRGSGFNCRYDV